MLFRSEDVAPGPFAVVDVGGGSTELVTTGGAISMQMGSVRLTERFVRTDPPSAENLRALEATVALKLDEARHVPAADANTLIAVAGTATTVQGIALELGHYDPEQTHRTWLTLEAADGVLIDLAQMTNAERAAIPVMPPGRGDVIVAGAVILVAVMRRFGFDRVLVSEADILDGLVFEMLGIR